MTDGPSEHLTTASPGNVPLAWLCLVLAVIGTAGSLFLSLGLGLKACPLCFYQRSFVMSAAAVLAGALWVDPARPGLASFLALPLAWAGFGVAAFHEWLVIRGVLECPTILPGWGSAPAQSLVLLGLLSAGCTAAALRGRRELPRRGAPAVAATILVGLLLAAGSIVSAPPLPPQPKAPYDPVTQPLDMCRPPFRGA